VKAALVALAVGCAFDPRCPDDMSERRLGDIIESDCPNPDRLRPGECTALSEAVVDRDCRRSWLSICPGQGYMVVSYDERTGEGLVVVDYPECRETYTIDPW
jgi:hypothetical protein